MNDNTRSYLTELVGTFAVVFFGAAAVCADRLAGEAEQRLTVALAEGFALAAALAFAVPHSTGFFNPAVTLTLWVFKRLDGLQTTLFIFVQLVGAALAGGLVRLIFAGSEQAMLAARLGTPHVNLERFHVAHMTSGLLLSGIATEICCTFFVTFVIFGTLIDPRAPRYLGRAAAWLAPLWVGIALVAAKLACGPITGGAANPARWFGPVVWENTIEVLRPRQPFSDNMVYWIGPILGALIAGSLYTTLVLPAEETPAPAGTPPSTTTKPPSGPGTLFRSKK